MFISFPWQVSLKHMSVHKLTQFSWARLTTEPMIMLSVNKLPLYYLAPKILGWNFGSTWSRTTCSRNTYKWSTYARFTCVRITCHKKLSTLQQLVLVITQALGLQVTQMQWTFLKNFTNVMAKNIYQKIRTTYIFINRIPITRTEG